MGTWNRGGARAHRLQRQGHLALLLLAAVVLFLAIAPAARATFHLVSIREVYPGSAAAPQSSYVELQMYADGQNFVAGHPVKLYNAAGGLIGTFSFGDDLAGNGVNQQTMLVGDDGVQAALGVTPDLVSSSFNVPASGGAACWAETIDCVAWGSFDGSAPSPAGTPVDGSGIPNGMALRRRISAGTCTNLLDGADDTNDSATDFADATPAPLSYTTVPSPMSCTPVSPPPTAVIDTKPPSATSATAATFTFHSNPVGAGFECRLDVEPFGDCDSGSVTYPGPISEASHTFQVRASNANGTGAPTSYSWKVDLTPPTTSITGHPVDPSPGATASFKYSSSESGSSFECSLVSGAPDSFSACAGTGRTYANLADGSYTFKVRATDKAGNQGLPAVFGWEVDNSIVDAEPPGTIDSGPSSPSGGSPPPSVGPRTPPPLPPQTTIAAKPPARTRDRTPTFRFASSVPGSTFLCKLDGHSFKRCRSPFTTRRLSLGHHVFKVKARTSDGVTDRSPTTYRFKVVKPGAPSATESLLVEWSQSSFF